MQCGFTEQPDQLFRTGSGREFWLEGLHFPPASESHDLAVVPRNRERNLHGPFPRGCGYAAPLKPLGHDYSEHCGAALYYRDVWSDVTIELQSRQPFSYGAGHLHRFRGGRRNCSDRERCPLLGWAKRSLDSRRSQWYSVRVALRLNGKPYFLLSACLRRVPSAVAKSPNCPDQLDIYGRSTIFMS